MSRRFTLFAVVLFACSAALHAQTPQASCTFHTYALTSNPDVTVTGVNNFGTVVGFADFGKSASPQFRAFILYKDGSTVYWVPAGAKMSSFGGHNNLYAYTGVYVDSSNKQHAFILERLVVNPIVRPYGSVPAGVNKYDSVVGSYADSNGNSHGFKRYSDGTVVHLNYPGSAGTHAVGINDSGTIVGFYDGTDGAEHGFIYHNAVWAKLQLPNAPLSTELYGISNAGVIVGQGQAHAYLYANGHAKEIMVPGSTETDVRAIAPNGLIAGMADNKHAFVASCH
jgi:probable HAF family extracellular repeat protein